MEKEYVVPEEMLKTALDSKFGYTRETMCFSMLEAAIRWLAENPIVPNDEQALYLHDFWTCFDGSSMESTAATCAEWQRRMFLAPGPEVPEAVRDLLVGVHPDIASIALEAYRLGLKAGQK